MNTLDLFRRQVRVTRDNPSLERIVGTEARTVLGYVISKLDGLAAGLSFRSKLSYILSWNQTMIVLSIAVVYITVVQ